MKFTWVDKFEEKYGLKLFINDETGVAFFEKHDEGIWIIKIDENKKMITFNNMLRFKEHRKNQEQMFDELLLNMDKWNLIGLSNNENTHELLEFGLKDNKLDCYYQEKEVLNAFGNKDWKEF